MSGFTSGYISVIDGNIFVQAVKGGSVASASFDKVTPENMAEASRILLAWMKEE